MKNNKLFIPSIASIVFFVLSLIFYGFYQLGDDTYIYLQYAKNLLANGELAFNAGQRTYGFTSPVWLGLITAFNYFIKDLTQVPRVLSMLMSMASIFVWYYILKRLFKIVPFWAIIPIMLEPNLLKHSNLGMEASLSFFLASMMILQLMILKEDDFYSYYRVSIPAGIFFLVRPESIILFVFLLIYLALVKRFSKKDLLLNIAVFAVIIIPWTVFAYNYFGSMLPSTFSAKGGTFTLGTRFFMHIIDSAKIFGGNYIALILVLFVATIFIVKSKRKLPDDFFTFLLIPVIFVLFYALVINREFVYARYYCIVFPFMLYCFYSMVIAIDSQKAQYILIIILSLQFLATAKYSSELSRKSFESAERVEDQIIEWVIANTSMSDKIVRGRIGKIAFQTDRTIIDPQGIVNPDILPFIRSNEVPKYFEQVRPDYLISDTLNLSSVLGTKCKAENKIIYTFGNFKLARDFNANAPPSHLAIYKLTW